METRSEFSPVPQHAFTAPLAFEKQLLIEKEWGLSEGSLFLEGKGLVHETLRRICKRLDEAGIPYAVAGGLALFEHGSPRFTSDVDLLVSAEGLIRVHQELEGLGYVRVYSGSKNMRDAQSGVKVDFLVSGHFPGDGKPKPVCFPRPEEASQVVRGLRLLNLESLVELKLASGISGVERGKDLVDVQALIKQLRLPNELSSKLNPYVRNEYDRLWGIVNRPRRFVRGYAEGELTPLQIESMQAEGVLFEKGSEPDGPDFWASTKDAEVSHKYDMHEEMDF